MHNACNSLLSPQTEQICFKPAGALHLPATPCEYRSTICYFFVSKFASQRPIFICPIAIAYSMGQIIKSVCVCLSVCVSVCLSVCEHSHSRISWSIFTKIGTDVRTPKSKNEFVGGSISHHSFPYFAPQNLHFRPRGPENLIYALNVRESPKFSRRLGNLGRGTRR